MSLGQCKKALKEWFRLEKKRLQQVAYNNKKKEATAATKNTDNEVCIYSLHTYYSLSVLISSSYNPSDISISFILICFRRQRRVNF